MKIKRKSWVKHIIRHLFDIRFDNKDHKYQSLLHSNWENNVNNKIFFIGHKMDRILNHIRYGF
jgi:hypothetical protein